MSGSALDRGICAHAAAAVWGAGDVAVEMLAIGWAESGLDPKAKGDNGKPHKGCGSYGWLQVNSCTDRDAGSPVRYGDNPTLLYDPLRCARSASTIRSQQGPEAWSVYTSGKYREFLPQAKQLVAALDQAIVAKWAQYPALDALPAVERSWVPEVHNLELPVVGDVAGTANSVIDLARAVLNPRTWLRVIAVIAGAVLVAGALALLAADQAASTYLPTRKAAA